MMNQENRPPPNSKPSRLARVVRGKLDKPIRVALVGTDGLGKSTWASHAPRPVFIGAEDGTASLDVERMPEVFSWADILDCVDELATGDHKYQTVVLDTADWAEPLCWAHVAKLAKKPDVEAMPFGKGYTAALDQWRVLLSKFERIRNERGMHIIILAHTWIKTFKNPENVGDYDRFEMKLHAKASGLIREWADCVLFGNYETFTNETNGRVKGVSTGARVVHTQRTAAWDAKNRYDLPPTLPLDWEAFAHAVAAHKPAEPAKLRERIARLLESASPELRARVEPAVAKAADDAAKLARIADKLTADIGIASQEHG